MKPVLGTSLKSPHGSEKECKILTRWCTFSWSLFMDWLKSQKTDCSNPQQDLGPIKIQFWWFRVPLFLWCCGQACYYFPTKFKPRFGTKDECVEQGIWTTEFWLKWPCLMRSHCTLCFFFVGCVAEPKLNSWSGATVQQLFQDWLSVMWTSTFPVSFTTTDFVFCKSGVLLFLHHQDTMSY